MKQADKSWTYDRRTKRHNGPRSINIHGDLLLGPGGGTQCWYGIYWRGRFYSKHRRLWKAKVAAEKVLNDADRSPGNVCPAKSRYVNRKHESAGVLQFVVPPGAGGTTVAVHFCRLCGCYYSMEAPS